MRQVLVFCFLFPMLFVLGCTEEGTVAEEAPVAVEGEVAAGGAAGDGEEGAAEDAEEAPTELPTRRFLEVAGTVTIDGERAAVDAEIGATAKIETGADGHAVITLAPGGITEIRKDTTLTLGKSERKEHSLQLLAGTLWNFLPDGSSFEVITGNAVAGVRGTVFYVEAHNDKKSYICACDGEVEITGRSKKTFKKTPKSKMGHKAFFVTTRGKKDKAKKAKQLNHTDEQKMALMGAMEKAKASE